MRPDTQATSPLTVRTHSTAMGAHTTTPHTHDHRVRSPPRIMPNRGKPSPAHTRTRSPTRTSSPTQRLHTRRHAHRWLQTPGRRFMRSNSGPHLRPSCYSGAVRRPTPKELPPGAYYCPHPCIADFRGPALARTPTPNPRRTPPHGASSCSPPAPRRRNPQRALIAARMPSTPVCRAEMKRKDSKSSHGRTRIESSSR